MAASNSFSTPGELRREQAEVTARAWWVTAGWAGIIAGLVFAVLQMVLPWALLNGSFWEPLQMIAAMLMGPDALPPLSDMSLTVAVIGLLIHLVLSVLYGMAIAKIVHAMPMGLALLSGSVFGLVAIYLVNFHLIAPFLFPWFTDAHHWVTWLNHLLFGAVAAGAFLMLRRRAHATPRA